MALALRSGEFDTPSIELEASEMSFGVGLVIAMAVIAPPILWVAWWLASDIGAAGSSATIRRHRAT
jgi:hypothetical protein